MYRPYDGVDLIRERGSHHGKLTVGTDETYTSMRSLAGFENEENLKEGDEMN